jgi:acetyl-CoA carboxylase carboxyltransferase component
LSFEELLTDLEERKRKALAMGGTEKVKRQHDRGRLTARERIDKLLDPGSFFEFGLLRIPNGPESREDAGRRPDYGLRHD